VLIGMGGFIPAAEGIKRLLGIDALLMGFGLADDRVHSPNENFELHCFMAPRRVCRLDKIGSSLLEIRVQSGHCLSAG
jgi:hypothetical protein